MKISIAMATYNGMPYIKQQLDSIFSQTRRPDEVIICDDGSSDGTFDYIDEYIKSKSLNDWKLYKNGKRLGWRENFRRAISLTTSDIVFFCDQDDIWKRKKIERMSDLIQKHDIGCLYGMYQVIDADGTRNKTRDIKKTFSGKLYRLKFKANFYQQNPLGCCMAARRRIIDRYLSLALSEDDHDSQCPRLAALYDSVFMLDAPVIDYRIHGKNNSGSSIEHSYGVSNLEERISEISVHRKWLETVYEDRDLPQNRRDLLKGAIITEKMRTAYLTGNGHTFIRLVSRIRYYNGISQLAGDFAYRHGINKKLGKIRWELTRRLGR